MERLANIHPGEILDMEFLGPMHITVQQLAQGSGLPPEGVQEIVRGERAVTADIAWRLGRFFGMDPRFWMNLQNRYDLEEAQRQYGEFYAQIAIADGVGTSA